MAGLGRYYELDITCSGAPDAVTGYLINIREIDLAVRGRALPILFEACRTTPWTEPASLLEAMLDSIASGLRAPVVRLRWRLTPYYCVEMSADATDRFILRQQFDFAAAHRLHVASLSDARNREVFGRCNNPNSHGHNYRIEPAVEVRLRAGAPAMSLHDLERITMATIIDRFDHKNLSQDCPEFTGASGVNPSVENIARVFYELLAPRIAGAGQPGDAALRSMTVWETDRTCCVYEPAK
jgi:6-pyruvoyltetrahydropterin/6-carboxytetrahydropterin synthase